MKNNKLSQILIGSLSLGILVIALFFLFQSMGWVGNGKVNTTTEEQEKPFNVTINEETLKKVKELNDYGLPSPSNLGKQDPFQLGM